MPSPLEPASSEERAALGLPPLFVPFSEVITYPVNGQSNGITQGDPRGGVFSASDVQVFRPYTGRDDNPRMFCVYYSIVCQPEFRAFSFEVGSFRKYSARDVHSLMSFVASIFRSCDMPHTPRA